MKEQVHKLQAEPTYILVREGTEGGKEQRKGRRKDTQVVR